VSKTRGLTLIEVLIVISMIAFTSAMSAPSLMAWRSKAKLRGAAENLKAALEMAKLRAIQENGTISVEFFQNRYRIFVDNDRNWVPDPPANRSLLKNEIFVAGIWIDTASTSFGGADRTRFFGRGTAINGTAVLVNSSGNQKRITVSTLAKISIVTR
jgi:prepilin-type N-terminal cleavage/methylation domain-containing protein